MKKVDETVKNQIIGMMKSDLKPAEIARRLNIFPDCAERTIKNFKETGNVKEKFWSVRPRKSSINDDRLIFGTARQNFKAIAKMIAQIINPKFENRITSRTVSNRLQERKLFSYTTLRKPLLKLSDRIKRINFCRRMLKLTDEQLNSIVFSDES